MSAKTKNIVVPTDFSEFSASAIPWAARLAEDFDAEIHCVYVVEEPNIYSTLDIGPVAIPTVDELVESATERMKKFADAHLAAISTSVAHKIVVGRPSVEIVEYANSVEAGMIVMTTHGYSGVKHVLLGSTTEDVLRHAKCPVLSIRS